MKTELTTTTTGTGYWSRKAATVKIVSLNLNVVTKRYGELRAYFEQSDWDTNKDGLIYTDRQWIKDFRKQLMEKYGLTEQEVACVDYSEQGMQGDDYVSLDVKDDFMSNKWVVQYLK